MSDILLGRRAVLKQGTLLLAGWPALACHRLAAQEAATTEPLRIGLVTDLHHADKPANGSRHYRETLGKLAEAGERFRQSPPTFVVELGDLIDAADSVEIEQRYLQTVNREFVAVAKDRHYVLGNHCVDTLTKDEFLGGVGQARSYYSFDRGGFHFVVLDSCFRSDGEPYGRKNSKWDDANIPPAELEWLAADLKSTKQPTIVFAHQRLDVSTSHGVKNCPAVRQILEQSGRVLAVFQGHSHQNDYKEIAGIHYTTLVAMVEGSGTESNGYSLLEVAPDGGLKLTGFRKQTSHTWPRA
jgi:predicted phosphodiesterase